MTAARADVKCPACGAPVSAEAERCGFCGAHFLDQESEARKRESPAGGERERVTAQVKGRAAFLILLDLEFEQRAKAPITAYAALGFAVSTAVTLGMYVLGLPLPLTLPVLVGCAVVAFFFGRRQVERTLHRVYNREFKGRLAAFEEVEGMTRLETMQLAERCLPPESRLEAAIGRH